MDIGASSDIGGNVGIGKGDRVVDRADIYISSTAGVIVVLRTTAVNVSTASGWGECGVIQLNRILLRQQRRGVGTRSLV